MEVEKTSNFPLGSAAEASSGVSPKPFSAPKVGFTRVNCVMSF